MSTPLPTPAVNTILRTGFIAGTLDITAAITVYAFVLGKATPLQILQGIASGIFGREAYAGGVTMALCGLVFHYVIALTFTTGYFLVFPYLPLLRKHPVISGLLFGVFVWVVMNLAVLPLSKVNQGPFHWGPGLTGMIILMLMIGLPVSLMIHRYYTRQAITAPIPEASNHHI